MGVFTICYLIAVILGTLATFGVGHPRFSLGWAALTFMALGTLLGGGLMR